MNNKNLELQINQIIEFFNKGLLDRAKNDTLRLLKTNFNIPFLHYLLGLINHGQNNLNEAKSNYKKATQLDKNYSVAFNNLGGLLVELNSFEEARENLLKANRLDPKLIDAYINLGALEGKLKNHNQEIIYYKKALEIDPNSDIVNYNLSVVYISQRDFHTAKKKYLKKTIDINPKFYNALNNMGGIFLAEGDKEKAISYFNKAIENNSNNAEAYRLLSDNTEFTSVDALVERMIEVAKKSVNLKENQMHINFALGKTFDDLKKIDEAFIYFTNGNKIRKELLNYDIDFDKKLFKSIKSKF
ncbi:tetratricopeptide repeat protein, partial [Pelagibacterales bacterium]|nr:tetratricopeptide repeat protein [Pelagibacterales bacterium]